MMPLKINQILPLDTVKKIFLWRCFPITYCFHITLKSPYNEHWLKHHIFNRFFMATEQNSQKHAIFLTMSYVSSYTLG
jgi:hypothetical protein